MKKITEQEGIHKKWYKEAETQTVKTLPEFMRKLTEDYKHDNGTICHAVTASMLGAGHAIDNSKQGGITGFQAGCIMWQFIIQWTHKDAKVPRQLIEFDNMLYPQLQDKFGTITLPTWKWLKKEAKKRLEENNKEKNKNAKMHPNVKKHMQSICNGYVPFGYVIYDSEKNTYLRPKKPNPKNRGILQ